MKSPIYSTQKYAICVNNRDYPVSLELHKLYHVLPDEDAAVEGDLRIIDESGEYYLYPADYFLVVESPRVIRRALQGSFEAALQPV